MYATHKQCVSKFNFNTHYSSYNMTDAIEDAGP